jgi:GntR family transcriptional regulator / MocR family aminotransferase
VSGDRAITVDRSSRIPLHRQIAAALKEYIRDGSLAAGTLLPSTRGLAREVGVSRNTVLMAYEALARQALIVCAPGAAARVSGAMPVVKLSDALWRRVVRETRFPQRMATFLDQDGNQLYVSTR